MKFVSSKKSKDSYNMSLESDLRQDGQITIGHHDEDYISISQDESNNNLVITYRWEIQQDKPPQKGRYRVLLFHPRSKFADSPYYFPAWHVARWNGESWTLPYLYPVEVGYGYDTFYRDVSQQVIRWEKLPEWMPVEVVD